MNKRLLTLVSIVACMHVLLAFSPAAASARDDELNEREIDLHGEINVGVSTGTATVVSPPPTTTIDWTPLVITILTAILSAFVEPIAKAIIDFLKRISWWRKHHKSRTPVVAKPL